MGTTLVLAAAACSSGDDSQEQPESPHPTDWDDDEQAARYGVATFVVAGQRPSSDPQAAALLPSIVERAQIVDHTFSDEVSWGLRTPGRTNTLADDDVLVALARRLDRETAYSAQLSRLADTGSIPCLPAVDGARGVGLGFDDDDGPVLLFAVAFDDEGTAADRSSEMSRWLNGWVATPTDPLADQVSDQLVPGSLPWTDLVSVESAEARGSVVVVRLRLTEAAPAPAVWMATTLGPAGQILSESQEAVRQNC